MEKDLAIKYNAFQTKQGNTVWCGTLCLAWQDLAKTHGLNHLQMVSKNPNILSIVSNFNNSPFTQKDINSKSIYIKTGKGPNTLQLINKEVKQKLPKCSFPDLKINNLQETDIISVAYLWKQLTFKSKFERRKQSTFLFNNSKVESFYAQQQAQKKQIQVCQYADREHFCIRIADKLTTDVIYFLKQPNLCIVDDVLKKVTDYDSKEFSFLKNIDTFEMPVIELDCQRSVKQLIGQRFSSAPLKQYMISVMIEAVKVKVDESGAKVESKAVIVASKGMTLIQQAPRQFLLDKTFWMVIKQKGKHPYICLQVVNPIDK